MADKCSACNKGELSELVPGIKQCSVCWKVLKDHEAPVEEVVE